MAWHRIENAAGEVQIVASLDGIDLSAWKATPLKAAKAPTEFQDVAADGSVATNAARRDKAQRQKRFREMNRSQLFDYLEALEARVAALEAKA